MRRVILTVILIFTICYVIAYFSIRKIEKGEYIVEVHYLKIGYRQYVLDIPLPQAYSKIESGVVFENEGERSYLIRIFRPLELLEVKTKYKIKEQNNS